MKKYYDQVDKLNQSQLVTRAEYLKVKAQDMQADFQVISSEEDVKLARLILLQTMNMDADQGINIKPVKQTEKILSIGLENCYSLALANNPEFGVKGAVIEYYNYERKMRKAKGWPKIDFDGSFGGAYENYEPLSLDRDYSSPTDNSGPVRAGRQMEPEWYAGIKGSVPLWGNTVEYNYVKEQWGPTVSAFRGSQSATNYFTLKILDDLGYFSDLQEARVGFDRAVYEYEKAKQDLIVEVRDKYFQYRKSVIHRDIAEAQLNQEKVAVELMEAGRSYGEVDASRIIDEMVKLAEYEYGVIQTDNDYYLSIIGLNKTIGIPEYFKTDYENEEYTLNKQAVQAAEVVK
ncbi:Outer membrane efflux protein [Candidatus Omnitrophus magneticus]|uniref:Outer membrane efflux protein n=1 Tax=Candidatus Omnitrophus magneticus TaxID=1609969 RepID=A0A0F0CRF5_9BACT|nr:Outer membrane efflux protein [Candidatus Omnitrophus magneticus]